MLEKGKELQGREKNCTTAGGIESNSEVQDPKTEVN